MMASPEGEVSTVTLPQVFIVKIVSAAFGSGVNRGNGTLASPATPELAVGP